MEVKPEYSFKRGWVQRRAMDTLEIKTRIMRLLDITTDVGFNNRMYGYVNYNNAEKEAVERIFNEFGITDVWGVPDGK